MVSLKQLNSLALVFALDSKCGGLHLLQRLRSSKLASTNPACEVTHKIIGAGKPASLTVKFADGQQESLDISSMHGEQVFEFISRRAQERTMQDVLAKNNFVGKKLASAWGL